MYLSRHHPDNIKKAPGRVDVFLNAMDGVKSKGKHSVSRMATSSKEIGDAEPGSTCLSEACKDDDERR